MSDEVLRVQGSDEWSCMSGVVDYGVKEYFLLSA